MNLVTGATGNVGRAAVHQLQAMGHPVAAMARDAGKAAALLPSGTQLRVADYDDPASLARAIDGIDTLLFVASDGDADTVMRHHAHVIDAVGASSVEHLVFTSIVDISESSPFYFAHIYRDAERRIGALGIAATILRCGLYAEFLLTHWIESAQLKGKLELPVAEALIAPVSRDDVAVAAAIAVASPSDRGKHFEWTGPKAYSMAEIASLASECLGVPIHYSACSPGDYLARATVELEEPWPKAFSTLCASIVQGRYARVSPDFEALAGRLAEPLAEFFQRLAIRDHIEPWLVVD